MLTCEGADKKPGGPETLIPTRYLIKGRGEAKPEGNRDGQNDGDRAKELKDLSLSPISRGGYFLKRQGPQIPLYKPLCQNEPKALKIPIARPVIPAIRCAAQQQRPSAPRLHPRIRHTHGGARPSAGRRRVVGGARHRAGRRRVVGGARPRAGRRRRVELISDERECALSQVRWGSGYVDFRTLSTKDSQSQILRHGLFIAFRDGLFFFNALGFFLMCIT